jgi:hypothetical protein
MKTTTLGGAGILVTLVGCSDPPKPAAKAVLVEEKKEARPEPVVRGKAVGGWIGAYDRGDAIERRQAVAALGEIAAYADRKDQPEESKAGGEAVEALVKALTDRDTEVRLGAAHALGKAGLAAKAANPALRKARDEDADATVREAAKRALEKTDAVPGRRPDIFDKIVD